MIREMSADGIIWVFCEADSEAFVGDASRELDDGDEILVTALEAESDLGGRCGLKGLFLGNAWFAGILVMYH